jgi:hypothetical protein
VDSGDLLRVCKSPVADEFWRSAGPVLRSQGTWGRVGLSRWRARGNRVWTFQCLLWTDPAPLGVFWRSAGSVLRSLRRLREGWGFRAVREGILLFASKARSGPIPLRLAYGALRGNGPALAEEAPGRMGFSRCARGDFGVRLQGSLRTDPASLGRVLALRGIDPALAEEALVRIGFSRCARGILVFASKARCGPIPLRLAYGALRGNGPALAEEAPGRMGFSRCARGDFVVRLQGSLWTDPASLGRMGRSAGSILRSLRRLWGGWGFRALREGFWCSPPRLATDRSRSAWAYFGAPRERSCAR